MGNQEAMLLTTVAKMAWDLGFTKLNSMNHFVLYPKGQRKVEMPTEESPFLYNTHTDAHIHAHSLLETILALTLSHFSDPASQAYRPSKVRDSQECLPMLSHPQKDLGNHKGGVPLNVRSTEKKASHHPWSLLNL